MAVDHVSENQQYTNTSYLFLVLYHASVKWISIVFMQITTQNERALVKQEHGTFRNIPEHDKL